jgi:hypothetical protein
MTPFDLTDPAEGGLGKDDPLLLRFEESTPASDYTGRYADGAVSAGYTEPTFLREPPPLDRTLSGSGRVFTAGSLYYFQQHDDADQAGTTGSVGVAAVVDLDWDAQWASGMHAVLAQQGENPSQSWGVRLELVDPVSRLTRVRMFWFTGGVEAVVDAAEFTAPTGPFLVIASRELTDAGFVVRYAAAGEVLGQTLVVGQTPDFNDAFAVYVGTDVSNHLHGVIDQVHVVHRAITLEECELVDYRLRQAGPEAYAARRSLMTGVKAWGTDLHLVVQRELQIEACVLALAKTNARRLARYVLRPDRSWGSALRYWEQIVQIPTRPGDGIDERRARVVTAMKGRLGCSETDLEALLAEALGYTADPTQADFTPGSNEYTDNFDPLVLASNLWVSGHAQHAWLPYPNTHFTFTQPAGGNDYLQGDQAGTDDLRYQGWLGAAGVAEANPPMYLRFIGSGAGRQTNALGQGAITGGKELWARIAIRAGSTIPAQLLVGLVVGSIVDDEWIWFGIRNNGGNNDLVAVKYVGGLLDTNFTTLEPNVGALPRVIEVRHLGDGKTDIGNFSVRQAANVAGLAAALWSAVIGGPTRPDWGGPAAVSPSSQPNVTGPTVARWADWWHYAPHAGAKQHVRVFRDPADPGIYDVSLADAILQKNLLAHMGGTVIDAENGLTLENVASLLDRDPLEH